MYVLNSQCSPSSGREIFHPQLEPNLVVAVFVEGLDRRVVNVEALLAGGNNHFVDGGHAGMLFDDQFLQHALTIESGGDDYRFEIGGKLQMRNLIAGLQLQYFFEKLIQQTRREEVELRGFFVEQALLARMPGVADVAHDRERIEILTTVSLGIVFRGHPPGDNLIALAERSEGAAGREI